MLMTRPRYLHFMSPPVGRFGFIGLRDKRAEISQDRNNATVANRGGGRVSYIFFLRFGRDSSVSTADTIFILIKHCIRHTVRFLEIVRKNKQFWAAVPKRISDCTCLVYNNNKINQHRKQIISINIFSLEKNKLSSTVAERTYYIR